MKIILLIIIFNLSFIYGKLPNDVRWARESKEYKAMCYQVYNNANKKLKKK